MLASRNQSKLWFPMTVTSRRTDVVFKGVGNCVLSQAPSSELYLPFELQLPALDGPEERAYPRGPRYLRQENKFHFPMATSISCMSNQSSMYLSLCISFLSAYFVPEANGVVKLARFCHHADFRIATQAKQKEPRFLTQTPWQGRKCMCSERSLQLGS